MDVLEGASGGDATANGFTVSASGTTVLAFSFTGSVVPAGEGTLVELLGEISEDCLSEFIFSNISGESLAVSFPVTEVLGCTDQAACNFDESANTDDGSCQYSEENFDCDDWLISIVQVMQLKMSVEYVKVTAQKKILIVMAIVQLISIVVSADAIEDCECEGDGSSCSNNDGGCSDDADVCDGI